MYNAELKDLNSRIVRHTSLAQVERSIENWEFLSSEAVLGEIKWILHNSFLVFPSTKKEANKKPGILDLTIQYR